MKLSELLTAFRAVAPEHLAEPWDKVGLHAGSLGQDVSRGLLCIDLTHGVIDEAVSKGCQLIAAYHPPIFQPLARLTGDGPWTQTRMVRAVREGLAVYSPHTALDAVRGGMNDWLCQGLGAGSVQPIEPAGVNRDEYKVVVFVPIGSESIVRDAMAQAGAGWIGNYRACTFAVEGEGGFRPIEGANPTIGKVGERQTVAEKRMEMIVAGAHLGAVVAALRGAHPYEEPAFDIFRLEPEPVPADQQAGSGRLLTLDDAIDAATLAQRVKQRLGVAQVKLAAPAGSGPIATVAVCVGSGGKLFESVQADAYVTGEMQHHQALDLAQRGRAVVLAGHTNTERPYLPAYRDRLVAAGAGIDWLLSEADKSPLAIV